jgi:Skp family chaperone for outer membrane proteins
MEHAMNRKDHCQSEDPKCMTRNIWHAASTSLPLIAMTCLLGCPDSSRAQTQDTSSATHTEPAYGPAIPGVCVFSRDAAIDNSTAGQAATKRMQALTQQVNTELQPERDAIAKEQSTLSAQGTKLPAADLKFRTDALAIREQVFNQKLHIRNAQLVKTRQDALSKLTDALRPALVGVITANKCGAVLERANIYGFNAKMEITSQVTATMNSAIQPFSFDLVPEAILGNGK